MLLYVLWYGITVKPSVCTVFVCVSLNWNLEPLSRDSFQAILNFLRTRGNANKGSTIAPSLSNGIFFTFSAVCLSLEFYHHLQCSSRSYGTEILVSTKSHATATFLVKTKSSSFSINFTLCVASSLLRSL